MNNLTRHLDDADETYFQHMRFAMSFAGHMLIGAVACAIHGLVPFLFETTGSRRIRHLHERMVVARKEIKPAPGSAALRVPENSIQNAAPSGVE